MTFCMDYGLHDAVLHATSSHSKRADRKSSNGKMRGVITVLAVQPLLVVENSNFSPSRLTFPLDALYASFSEGDCPFSSFQTKRILYEPTDVLVLPPVLSRAALCPVLAPSWSCPVASSCQDTYQAPPSALAPLPRRWPRLSTRLHGLVGRGASVFACAALARGQKPPRSPQTQRHRRFRLSQSTVPVLRDRR